MIVGSSSTAGAGVGARIWVASSTTDADGGRSNRGTSGTTRAVFGSVAADGRV